MNIEQIRAEVGPEAAKLAQKFAEREELRRVQVEYDRQLTAQLQNATWAKYMMLRG